VTGLSSCKSIAKPKSPSLIEVLEVMKIFSGFTSLCTIPWKQGCKSTSHLSVEFSAVLADVLVAYVSSNLFMKILESF
jgi:hypothetical protein